MMKKNAYDIVTDRIIAELESGTVPWVRPWSGGTGMPYNAISNKGYSGINVPLCWMSGHQHDAWMTFKQLANLGGNVKGQKGTMIVFAKSVDSKTEFDDKGQPRRFFVHRGYTVFNLDQIEGLPAEFLAKHKGTDKTDNPAIGCAASDQFIKDTGAVIKPGHDKAFYTHGEDYIGLPEKEQFDDMPSYYATALHELTHWTGHKSRLDRAKHNQFGDATYAKEELIAEMGAAFLCAHLGIEGKLQHASYIQSWLKALRDDRRLIFTAASQATKASELLKGFSDQHAVAA